MPSSFEMAMLGQEDRPQGDSGVEKYTELGLFFEVRREGLVSAQIGNAGQAGHSGGGRWHGSGGAIGSNFGLHRRGASRARRLEGPGCGLLKPHFHWAADSNIGPSGALNEAARIYTELVRRGRAFQYWTSVWPGRDYDGSQKTSSPASLHARGMPRRVYHIQTVCNDVGCQASNISRSGQRQSSRIPRRADIQRFSAVSAFREEKVRRRFSERDRAPLDRCSRLIRISGPQCGRGLSRCQQALDMALELFSGGYFPRPALSGGESLFLRFLLKLKKLVDQMDDVPEDSRPR